jgi:hypothetical protein
MYNRVDKEEEMTCLIEGCNFLLKNIHDEVFIYQRHGNPEYRFPNVDPCIFPYLLVNIGSGVSIMKVFFRIPCSSHSKFKQSFFSPLRVNRWKQKIDTNESVERQRAEERFGGWESFSRKPR